MACCDQSCTKASVCSPRPKALGLEHPLIENAYQMTSDDARVLADLAQLEGTFRRGASVDHFTPLLGPEHRATPGPEPAFALPRDAIGVWFRVLS